MNMQDDSQHHKGFSSGLILGMVLGGIAAYMFAAPDGKKKFKESLEKGEEILALLEEKVGVNRKEVGEHIKEAYEEHVPDEAQSFISGIRKRFFKKNGKKIK